jgi:4-hydroxy-3-methylbut-2-enyl diphosphate reductase
MNAPFQDPAQAKQAAADVLIAAPRGFCAGVDRAIEIVERALERFGAPVYVRHEIVHNRYVVEGLQGQGRGVRRGARRGARRAPVVFSAHGVPKAVPPRPSAASSPTSTRHARW